MNLHNFAGGFDPEASFRQAQLVFNLVLVGLTVNGRVRALRPARSGASWHHLFAPLPLFLTMPAYRIYRLFTPGEVNFAVRLQEWAEFCQYLGLALAIACLYVTVRPSAEPIVDIRPESGHCTIRDWKRLATPAVLIGLICLALAVMTLFSKVRAYN
jgi:hypothetical protein